MINNAQLNASPCLTLLAILIITDLYPFTMILALMSL